MPFTEECAIYGVGANIGEMCHFWSNVTFMEQVPFLQKCVIYGAMCHLWSNVSFLEKCNIYGAMGHFLRNMPFMEQCCDLWVNLVHPVEPQCKVGRTKRSDINCINRRCPLT